MGEDILIIGAGPAGLAVSSRQPRRSRILEAGTAVGGLCRSLEFAGAVFDIGGHCFHSPHAEVNALVEDLMQGRWSRQRRDARVYFDGQLIDYPFQKHFHALQDPAVVEECRAGLPADGSAALVATDFEDWIGKRFGPGIARHFMLPYNRKLWGGPLSRIGCEWLQQRVVGAEGGADTGQRQPLNSDSEVAYPAEGGFEEIFKSLVPRCGPIEFGSEVRGIDPASRSLRTRDGRRWSWQQLVSTMPLTGLLPMIEGVPAELLAQAAQLEYLSLKLLLIAARKPVQEPPQRVYLADPDIPPHKIAFNHTSSPSLRRRPVQGIACEIACPPDKPLPSDAELTRRSLDWLLETGLVGSAADVVETRMLHIRHAYPVPTRNRAAIVAAARKYLSGLGIHSIGRFGGWDYANSDDCLRQGLELGGRLALNLPPRLPAPTLRAS